MRQLGAFAVGVGGPNPALSTTRPTAKAIRWGSGSFHFAIGATVNPILGACMPAGTGSRIARIRCGATTICRWPYGNSEKTIRG